MTSYLKAQDNNLDKNDRCALEQLTLLTETYGLRPIATSYNYVLHALAAGRRGRKAYQLLQQMKERGVTPDSWSYTKAIEACGRTKGMHLQNVELFREMPDEDKSSNTYSLALDALATVKKRLTFSRR